MEIFGSPQLRLPGQHLSLHGIDPPDAFSSYSSELEWSPAQLSSFLNLPALAQIAGHSDNDPSYLPSTDPMEIDTSTLVPFNP
jgi:hypothetical protein